MTKKYDDEAEEIINSVDIKSKEEMILSANPDDMFEIITGFAYNCHLVKLKIKIKGRLFSHWKTIWVFEQLDRDIVYIRDTMEKHLYLNLLKASGAFKTKVESYTIYTKDVQAIKISKTLPLNINQTFALKKYFAQAYNNKAKNVLFGFSKYVSEKDVCEVQARWIQKYLNDTKYKDMKEEALRWVFPKKPEKNK